MGTSQMFPSSPLIFVNREGVYKCCVKSSGVEVTPPVINVQLKDVGKFDYESLAQRDFVGPNIRLD